MDFSERLRFHVQHYGQFWFVFILSFTVVMSPFTGNILGPFLVGIIICTMASMSMINSESKVDFGFVSYRIPKPGHRVLVGMGGGLLLAGFFGFFIGIVGFKFEKGSTPNFVTGFFGLLGVLGMFGIPIGACLLLAKLGSEAPEPTAEEANKLDFQRQLRKHYNNIVLALVVAVAFLSNPSEASFKDWIMKEIGQGLPHPALKAGWELLAKPEVLKAFEIEHSNYLVCSTVTLKPRLDGPKMKFVGAFTFWWRYA